MQIAGDSKHLLLFFQFYIIALHVFSTFSLVFLNF